MRTRRTSSALFVVAVGLVATSCSDVFVAACNQALIAESSGPITDPALNEISGLGAGIANPDVFWAHNDSGDSARIFALDATGAVRGTYLLAGVGNIDWEDLAVVAGPTTGSGAIYVADIGDNLAARSEIQVYRVPEPVVPLTGAPAASTLSNVTTFRLTYPTGGRDAEALIVDPLSGDLTIVTKSILGGPQAVYRAPANLVANSTTELSLVGQLTLDAGIVNSVTAADISPDGETIAVRTYGSVKLFHRRDTASVANALVAPIGPCSVTVLGERQGESVAFSADGESFVTVSEGLDQILHTFSAPPTP